MKIKFTKSSKNDKTLVTVQLAQLGLFFSDGLCHGTLIVLTVDGEPTVFRVNRAVGDKGITAATHTFPRFLKLPRVGKPVYADVSLWSSEDDYV